MKISRTHILIIVVVIAVLFLFTRKSGFSLSPASVYTNLGPGITEIFSGCDAKCTPGSPDENGKVMSAYYTPGLTPCGLCDDQAKVNKMMNYQFPDYEDEPLGGK
jgi:hypothetical protein